MNIKTTFWQHLQQNEVTGCWLWARAKDHNGYGVSHYERKNIPAHRLAYMLVHNLDRHTLPKRIIHSCGVRHCCSPNHLVAVVRRLPERRNNTGPHDHIPRGEEHSHAKLTWQAVNDIRASDARQIDLARRYGVTQSVISRVRLGHTWREK